MPPKSGHQRAKNINYDDDDVYNDDEYYEEEDGGDGMTDEDREQMRIGTNKVKEALGPSISVTDAQIQETLWHYYYDVDKSATYLKNKYAPATSKLISPPKKEKPISRFDQVAATAGSSGQVTPEFPLPPLMDQEPMTALEFFKDTPWGNVPVHRLGNITIRPSLPSGGLLGGSSKPSKLAALAASRKQKKQETKSVPDVENRQIERKHETDKAVALLDRLSLKAKDQTTSATNRTSEAIARRQSSVRYPLKKRQTSPEPTLQALEESPDQGGSQSSITTPDLRTEPSLFATTLCGIGESTANSASSDATDFPLPHTQLQGFAGATPFSGPSPDDIVLRAQGKGTKSSTKQAKKSNGDKLAESVDKLAVEETPKVKSRNLNVVEEFKKSGMKPMANFVVIGHVDHGKSTLMGRLLYDLKVIDQRSVDKLRKEAETIGKSSFALAWVMDQTSEERSRGVTVDIATNYFETDKTRFTILDAPGHKDFIPNMIAGASQADFAVLVIDSSTNSFESGLKGQTKEHALLVRSMGVQRLVVAVNKMDMVSWSRQRFEEISQQMTTFLTAASFSARSITFIPCAGLTGENVTRKLENPNATWYVGETLIEALDGSEPAKRSIEKPFRMTIGDVFRGGITNPISISGRIDAGSLQIGDIILAMPSNETAVIKGVEVENELVDWAVAGQIPTLHLADIDPIHLRMGDIVCDPTIPVKLIKLFTCKILAFDHVIPMSVDVFRGRLQAEGKIKQLVSTLNKASGEVLKKRPRIIKPGEVARVLVELEKELPLEAGTRVVLRESGSTVAAGLLEG